MYQIAVVVFRECLEIVLLLGVIGAVTRQVNNSKYLIALGVILGFALSGLVALSANHLANLFDGFGNEFTELVIIFLTIALIAWTIVWMKGHGLKIKKDFSELSTQIQQGNISKFMLISVSSLVVMREAVEIILFVYSISKAEKISTANYMLGASLGAISGALVGILIYFGLVKFKPAYMFKACSTLLILIAANLSTKAADIIAGMGAAPGLDMQLWDSSWLINNDSIIGKFLHALLGYQARPNLIQILCYSLTVIMIILLKNNNIKKISINNSCSSSSPK